ncbi:MAG TPA: GMC family oxidoreductase [Alphaproteobacteria bacterium]|nr:GMC family oxidoreductase [Alphaproteobacteria bacterium]
MPEGTDGYDVVAIGSGFANSFFLKSFLARRPGKLRVLVLERGPMVPHDWQTQHRQNSPIDEETTFRNRTPGKEWRFNIGFGGGSNCWTGHVPRMLPNDFRMASVYGVGRDWPVGYDDLEPFYEEAEAIMAVSGPDSHHPYPKRGPYPQPPHRLSLPDQILQRAQPDRIFALPTVRARVATATRAACCANGVCSICPVDAKFTILNGMADLYADERISLMCEAEAIGIEMSAGRASAVLYRHEKREHRAKADLVLLGANGIFNPALMLRSGLSHPMLGRCLHEQGGFRARVYLDGIDNFQGSSYRSAVNYALYDGPHRRAQAACIIEHSNVARLRPEFGRWRQVMELSATVEDLPDTRSYVAQGANDDKPIVVFQGFSDYHHRGMRAAKAALQRLLAPLAVERIEINAESVPTKAHVQGTTVMGDSPQDSVIDRTLRHHQVRNLFVLGSGCFPTGAPANPTLTICALSLWAAAHA